MSFSSRAAALAVATLSLVALLAPSAPGRAAELPSLPVSASLTELVTDAQVPTTIPAIATTMAGSPTTDSAPLSPQQDEQVAYPTLAAAVADQSVSSNVDDDLRCLAGAIYFEARGEPLAGQLAVAEVILNRAASGRFRQGVCAVVTQPGQFSFVRSGRVPDVRANDDYLTAVAVAKVAIKDAWESDAADALYFHARHTGGFQRVRVAAIGNHVFYR